MFPWIANARAVMQNETVGWVKSIHETRYGELLGIVMVGPHVTDLIEAGVVALDAESTVETVADGMAAHPTLSEAIKEAGLVALGRADSFAAEAESHSQGLSEAKRKERQMGVVNRRNAMLGWAVWQVGKQVAKQKAKKSVKACRGRKEAAAEQGRARRRLVAVGGVLVFWRKKGSDDELPPV